MRVTPYRVQRKPETSQKGEGLSGGNEMQKITEWPDGNGIHDPTDI